MRWIDTVPDPTQVVQLEAIWYLTDQTFIHVAMGKNLAVVNPNLSVSIWHKLS